jgi:hypothetical protein
VKPLETVREIQMAVAVWAVARRWNSDNPKEVLHEWLTDGVPKYAIAAIARQLRPRMPDFANEYGWRV